MAQLVKNLPVGSKIKFGKHSINGETPQEITWLLVAKNHTQTPKYTEEECATFLTEKVIDFRCYDASEPNNTESGPKAYGNASYTLSNIRQWLNKTVDNWFTPTHDYDEAPTSSYSDFGTHYSGRPGFLKHFSSDEIDAIIVSKTMHMDMALQYWEETTSKVFLPSAVELLGGYHSHDFADRYNENQWEYFISNSVSTTMTQQAHDHTSYTGVSETWIAQTYWLREGLNLGKDYAYYMHSTNTVGTTSPKGGGVGVRPAMNLRANTMVTDTVDSDGCYSVIFNNAPTAPSTISASNIKGGAHNVISWSAATDADGDSLTYTLLRFINNEVTSKAVYTGTDLRYSDFVEQGTTTVKYTVFATDSNGSTSDSMSTEWLTVSNNQAPVISGADANLGEKTSDFTQSYIVTDAENNTVTVVEAIDGVQLRSYAVTLGATNTISVAGVEFLKLNNGTHSITITATDSEGAKSVRTYTFTKNVPYIYIETNAMPASEMPTRLYMTVGRSIPEGATFTVKVTNNGNDASPTWEDATSSVVDNTVHNFSNTAKTAASWGVAIQVSVERNNAEGTCYVSSIGGNFE